MRRRILWVLAFLSSGQPGLAEAPDTWAAETQSPRPAPFADASLASSCRESDLALGAVALGLAQHRIEADDVDAVTHALRAAGEPHVWPRAMALEGESIDRRDAKARIDKWLGGFRSRGHLRCATAVSRSRGRETIGVVAVDAQADLEPIATVVRPTSWIDVDARVLVPAAKAKVVVLGPEGAPRAVPTTLSAGRIRARANVDRPGTWLFQVLIDGAVGPRPVLEAFVFAGVAPPRARLAVPAPGEEATSGASDAATLAEMVALARSSEALVSLRPNLALDRVARDHAERMRRAAFLGHDVGDGDASQRVLDAGIDAREVGENVAHAASLPLAHRALWASPSHRENLLGPRFTDLGVGVSRDRDGTVWVTEIFANLR